MTNERCKRCHHPKSDHQEACLKCRCEAFSCPDVCHTCKGRGYIIVGSGVPGTYSARNTSCPTCTKNELTERVRAALNDRTQTASKWADDDGGPNTFGASSWETGIGEAPYACGLHGRNAIDLNGVCIECERNSTKWREVTLVQDSAVIHGKQVIVYESSVGRWCWTASNGSSYNDRDSARAAAESELENDLHSQVTALKDALNLALCAINEEINRDHGRREYLLGIAKTARDALK